MLEEILDILFEGKSEDEILDTYDRIIEVSGDLMSEMMDHYGSLTDEEYKEEVADIGAFCIDNAGEDAVDKIKDMIITANITTAIAEYVANL